MFPLADARGRVLGFQARKLREDDPLRGKYVNSPEGDLFHKGSILYGLHLAKTAIGKEDFAAVVEGNTDVIALRQAGFEPVVASMGTALTERTAARARAHDEEALPLLRRRRGRAGGDAARDGARGRPGLRREGRHAPAGAGSRRCARRVRGSAERARRATSSTACGSRSSARPTGRRGSSARARCSRRPRTHPSARRRCGCSPTGSTFRARRSPGSRRRAGERATTPAEAPRLLDAGDRLERDVARGLPRPHGARPRSRRALARPLRLRGRIGASATCS